MKDAQVTAHADSSSAGAPAIAWGRQPLALSRAARAAENVGVVLGERLAGEDFEPTGPTPFRASVPPARRFRR
ncbi:MAG TPA: hypothetical protein VES79_01060, partial [Solirubrobacteraceae bacterium]|nr:hypothetical protein [Solirubrobacteraceae bacterium]